MGEPVRMSIAEAAAKLGVSVDAVRRRIRKRDIRCEKANDGKWSVWVDPDLEPAPPAPSLEQKLGALTAPAADAARTAQDALVAELRDRIGSLEAAVEREQAGREADRAAAAEERARLLAVVESMARAASERPAGLIERLFGRRQG